MAKARPGVLCEVPRLSHTATCSWQGQHLSSAGKPPPFKACVWQRPQAVSPRELVPLCKPLIATTALQQRLSLLYPEDVGQCRNRKHITPGAALVCLHSQAAGFFSPPTLTHALADTVKEQSSNVHSVACQQHLVLPGDQLHLYQTPSGTA